MTTLPPVAGARREGGVEEGLSGARSESASGPAAAATASASASADPAGDALVSGECAREPSMMVGRTGGREGREEEGERKKRAKRRLRFARKESPGVSYAQ